VFVGKKGENSYAIKEVELNQHEEDEELSISDYFKEVKIFKQVKIYLSYFIYIVEPSEYHQILRIVHLQRLSFYCDGINRWVKFI